MNRFVVTYRDPQDGDFDQEFACDAEDGEHAREQTLNAYPHLTDANIIIVSPSQNIGFTFTLTGTIDYAQLLLKSARERMFDDGLSEDDAETLRDARGNIDVAACLRLLLDPGALAGTSVLYSCVELRHR